MHRVASTYTGGLTAFAYGLNLNDAVDWYYTGQPIYVKQMGFFKSTIAIGLKYDFLTIGRSGCWVAGGRTSR